MHVSCIFNHTISQTINVSICLMMFIRMVSSNCSITLNITAVKSLTCQVKMEPCFSPMLATDLIPLKQGFRLLHRLSIKKKNFNSTQVPKIADTCTDKYNTLHYGLFFYFGPSQFSDDGGVCGTIRAWTATPHKCSTKVWTSGLILMCNHGICSQHH